MGYHYALLYRARARTHTHTHTRARAYIGPCSLIICAMQEGKLAVPLVTSQKWGMCMAACLLCPPTPSPHLHLLAGYEDGTVAVWDTGLPAALSPTSSCRKQPAPELVMQLKAHGEPLMALTASPTGTGESLSCCLCATAMATSLVSGITSQQHIGVQVPGLKHCCTTRVVNPTPTPPVLHCQAAPYNCSVALHACWHGVGPKSRL